MTDGEVEVSLQQLRNYRENELTYRRLAEQIEKRLADAGIRHKTTAVGTSWRRSTPHQGPPCTCWDPPVTVDPACRIHVGPGPLNGGDHG